MSSGLKDGNAADLFQHAAPQQEQKPAAQHAGHRQRLRDRFRNAGPGAFQDYELLEFLLFSPIPRQDTKPLAKDLLKRFNSFVEVITAPRARLKEVPGVGDAVVDEIELVREAALRLMRAKIEKRQVLASWDAVLDYCRARMGHEDIEQFRILFMDKRNGLIRDELQQSGTADHTPVYPRQVVKRALELSAGAIILVHNHPSGDTTPSKADIEMTKTIADAARPLGIVVHDHLIVGRHDYTSLKALGLF